eukprot:gene2040-17605_t
MSLSKPSKGTKWKGHYDESRRFKPEWQRKYPWVKKAVDGSEMLIPVVSATGKDLFDAMKACVEAAGLKMNDCVGFGSDGASAIVGEHDSVWSRVRTESPNCTIMKCICHSLALCIKHTFEQMPSHLGFLLSEIPKWFSKSTLRREAYKKLFDITNENSERASLPHPYQKFSQTRWLVRGKVIFNILVNLQELRAYFSIAELEGDAKVRYKARLIADMLRDPINLLYFHFLSPIVAEFERVNAFFQATDIDPHGMIKELNLFFDSLKRRVSDVNEVQLPLAKVDFGAKFLFEADALVDNNKERQFHVIKGYGGQGEALSYLHPSRVLSQIARVPPAELPMQHLMVDKLSEIDNQYRNIFLVNWREEPVFKDGIPQEAVAFWSGVHQYQNSVQEFPFTDLAAHALACLTTPTSNSIVERIFSYVTNVKTKHRNRMGVTMVEAIVCIRTHLHFGEKCCKDFVPSQSMLSLFNSDIMYPSAVSNKNEEDEIVLADFV